ncbi:tetratricopeptide repeat protein [Shimia sagamensis]|uniref:Uncharacterized protein n=1 Tax=Shimia sagamensis TaxID=1566352 RepID=A0ABY1P6Q4_9RHOB|nr:hypothetical protein [Shimia sagamensis]SMP27696.1 hypothetical protein SAMN06265373_105444 [Shimia sagamensis]
MRHTVIAACIMGLVGGVGMGMAEDAGAFWQPAREKFNKMSDDACDGDGGAFRELMQAAIMEEHPVAQNDLAWVFGTERCQYYADDVEAVAELQKDSADAGYPVAQSNIGVKYMEGDGVGQNTDLAIDYFEAAMRAGYGEGAAQLGIYFAEGIHLVQNIARADLLLEDAYALGADQDMIDRLAAALEEAAPAPAFVSSDRWAYDDGEAGYDLVQNGGLLARVFLGRDQETGGYYYGMYRVSDDPMIHFMGVSVKHANGRDTELDMNGCGGQNCLIDYGDSAQVRIPISGRNQAAMLEAFKSGDTIKFRYQTEASYAQNKFKNMTLGLKGSRKAIEAVQRSAPAPAVNTGNSSSNRPVSPPTSNVSDTGAQPEPNYTGGPSYYQENTKDGDQFCQAVETAEYPPHFYSEFEPETQRLWLESPNHTLKPADLDYLGSATTVWMWGAATRRSGEPWVLYKNGTAKRLNHTARDGIFDVYEDFSGSWQRDGARGVVLRMKSKWKHSTSGYDYIECTGGTLTTQQASGWRQGVKSFWQTCSMMWSCSEWSDKYPEKKTTTELHSLVEWAPGDIASKKLEWSQPRP